ncbi:TatD family hydrolase, partial [Cetobacterium sp.]
VLVDRFYLGIGGTLTFKNAKKTVEVVKEIPLDRIVIETDCPYLTPEPFRGKRNEPIYVEHVAQKIAEIKEISVEEVTKATTENAKKLYKIG